MVALLADIAPTDTPTDQRRITEHDPAMARLKARTSRQLAASIQQFVDDLKAGVQPVQAQSHFIDRHLAILRAAYLAAHREGQRDYYDAVSNTPGKWATHEADTATMQRRMAFYAPSVAKMAHEAVRAFQTVAHEPAQLDEAATDGGDDVVVRLMNYNHLPPGPGGGQFAPGGGGGSHGEAQHAGVGHVGEHVGAAAREGSYGGLGFHRGGGGAGGGAMGKATPKPAKVSQYQAMSKEERAAYSRKQIAAAKAKREAYAKEGLDYKGSRHSYLGYVKAHNAAEKAGDHALVAKLEKLYPQHEAERKSYHEQLGGHNRQALSQRRANAAKREDILSGDHHIASRQEYSQLMRRALKTNDHELEHALTTHPRYRAYHRWYVSKHPASTEQQQQKA